MKKTYFSIIVSLALITNSCITNNQESYAMVNPFFEKSTLPYQAPAFDKIKDEHFKPAFEEGLKQQNREIDAIIKNTKKPNFQNTILALETSGQILKRAQIVFYNLTSANTNNTLEALQAEYAPIFSAQRDKIFLNENLFQKVKLVYESRSQLQEEDKRLTEFYFEEFERSGANLTNDKKEILKKINAELASKETLYDKKLLEARKQGSVLYNSAEELAGLSNEDVETAKADAKALGHDGKYLLTITNTTQQPYLQNLTNRTTREKLFNSSWNRAEKNDDNDTRSVIEQMAKLRLKKAKLFGKNNFAEWQLQNQMAKNPENAIQLLKQLAIPAVAQVKKEAQDIQNLINKQGGNFNLQPWDWMFYTEQVRQEKYDLDESQIKPYFEVTTVLEKGVFYAAEKVYGITFKERKDLPVYHPDVVTYEVFDQDGKSIALYYLDFYTRDNKRGGAWMNNFVEQAHYLGQNPVIVNVFNYAKPIAGRPSLISYDDVTTMFHEFGHTLHGLFSNQQYTSISGTSVPRDFVEYPSQINEHWALEPSILKNYALHYETKQPMPQDLVKKIENASKFNNGFAVTEILAAAILDMSWHTITDESQITNANDFEQKALQNYGILVPEVPTRYHSPYFAHIWAGGYSAGYYAYIWSEVLDNDCFEWFQQHGGLTRKNGDLFREHILSVGNSKDLNEQYEKLTGRKPSIEPLLRKKGFIQ